MNVSIKKNEYEAKFAYTYRGFGHLCTARDMFDVQLTFYKHNVKWKTSSLIDFNDVPEWFVKYAVAEIAKNLHKNIESQYIICAMHVGTNLTWKGYARHAREHRALFEALSHSSMIIDNYGTDDGSKEFKMYTIHRNGLLDIAKSIMEGVVIPKEVKPEPEKKAGITLEQLEEYLKNV